MELAALVMATNDAADAGMTTRHCHTFSTIAKHTLLLLHVGIMPY
jgi:hypothetical protein